MTKEKALYSTSDFENFRVHKYTDNYTIFHIDICNEDKFMDSICEYLINDNRLLKYIENKTNINFTPSKKHYSKLYKELYKFIDDEYLEIPLNPNHVKGIEEIIDEEFEKIKVGKEEKIRLSKIGRIGEYTFHSILSEYFGLDCIIPKVGLTTDKNMSVYGIDELFIDIGQNIIFFGESKVTGSLKNGIGLINKSLANYEEEIREEYVLILSSSTLKLNGITQENQDLIDECISFDEFIKESKTQYIGVPIFIAHGEEIDIEHILSKLEKSIHKKKLFGLETKYYVISFPIISKDKLMDNITKKIRLKMEECDDYRKTL